MTYCFGGLVGLDCLERIVAKLREEFLFEPPASFVVMFVSYGSFSANFHVERNDHPRKDLPFDVCHKCTTLK